MRRAIVACALAGSVMASGLQAEPMKPGDRQRVLAHLEMTESWLGSELQGLSPAQLRHRPSPDAWHILDVVEHLAMAEPQYWKQLLFSPAMRVNASSSPAG